MKADAVKLVAYVPPALKDLKYIHNDHLGTPQVVTDDTGTIIWTASYTPFGEASINEDVDGDGSDYELNMRFPGQYFDQESGLHYNYFRDYDPETGRYIESDPIGLKGGFNTYTYGLNNSLTNIDQFGLWVRRCGRELGDFNGSTRLQHNPLRHDYLIISGATLSFQAGSNLLWSQGYVDPANEIPNRACISVCSDDKFDKYVIEAAREVGEPTYCVVAYPGTLPHFLGARNCQTWVDDVIRLAKKKYLNNEKCPDCF